jgi:hypothetical protein
MTEQLIISLFPNNWTILVNQQQTNKTTRIKNKARTL